jgi:AcrR family transcriptional regulator
VANRAQRELIIDAGFAKFRQFGVRRVTMDDIARELRISKKTIYRHFPDKAAMVQACTDRLAQAVMPTVEAALTGTGPVTARLERALQTLATVARMISAHFMADVRSDYPEVWQKIDERRRGILAHYERLITEGIATGEIRPEIHPRVALLVLLAVAEKVLVPDVLASGEFSPVEVFATVTTMFTYGVLVGRPRAASHDTPRAGVRASAPTKKRSAARSAAKEEGR